MPTHVEGLRDATNAVSAYRRDFETAVYDACRISSKRVTSWEKQTHRWKNVTTQAEKKIKCVPFREGTIIGMENAHWAIDKETGFKYGISLEFIRDGHYAILQTALRHFWAFTVQMIVDRMKV